MWRAVMCVLHPSSPLFLAKMAVAQVAIKQEAASPPPPLPPPQSTSHSPHDAGDPLGLEERILTLCTLNSKGITDDIIVQDQPTIDAEKRMRALQRLLSQVGVASGY